MIPPSPLPPSRAPRAVVVYDRPRAEERMLFDAFERLGVPFEKRYAPAETLDLSALAGPGGAGVGPGDVVLGRCLSQARGLALARVYEAAGAAVLNRPDVIERCGDKLATSAALAAAGVPAPRTGIAFGREGVLELCGRFGWPVVMKPVTGSWGRMVSRLRDVDAVEAVLEHKEALGGPQHKLFYVQEHVDKPGRDLRAFVVGERVVAAIHRESGHWITNTARGAVTSRREVDRELEAVCLAAARAVAGPLAGRSAAHPAPILAIDLVEGRDGLLVIEVNHTMEFRNSVDVTGVDIPGLVAAHAASLLRGEPAPA